MIWFLKLNQEHRLNRLDPPPPTVNMKNEGNSDINPSFYLRQMPMTNQQRIDTVTTTQITERDDIEEVI